MTPPRDPVRFSRLAIERPEPGTSNRIASRRYLATVAWEAGRAWIHVGGHVFVIEPARTETRRGSAAADHDALSSPMPATVARVHVKAGDTVAHGDVIILLEAMKMELPIRAPRDGVVARVNCTAGEMVQPGTPLVDLE